MRIVTEDGQGNIISDIGENPVYPELVVEIDKKKIVADGIDEATINIGLKLGDEFITDSDGISYFVPILKADGIQEDYKEIILSGGKATITFSTVNPSTYTVNIDLIEPTPIGVLTSNVKIIAKKA